MLKELIFPIYEAMMEAMNIDTPPWNSLHHRSYFASPMVSQQYTIETKYFLLPKDVD